MTTLIECRWGILGCGEEAAKFVAELQATPPSPKATQEGDIRHTIKAVSSDSIAKSRAFADLHIRAPLISPISPPLPSSSSISPKVEAFGTSTELHAHPSIDCIFIASSQDTRYQEAVSALRGGKSIMISKPLAMSSSEARDLCDLTVKESTGNDQKWLGFCLRSKQNLLLAANECAKGRANRQSESSVLPWADAIAVLEALDEVRDEGTLSLSIESIEEEHNQYKTPTMPHMSAFGVKPDTSIHDINGQPRRPASRSSQSSDFENLSTAALRSQLHELRHVLRQKNALINSLETKNGTVTQNGRSSSSNSHRPRLKGRLSLPPPDRSVLVTPSTALASRRRTSSLVQDKLASDQHLIGKENLPADGILKDDTIKEVNRDEVVPTTLHSRRKRRESNGIKRSSSPAGRSSTSSDRPNLDLPTVIERKGSNLNLGEGFLAPTIASENRRIANGGSPRLGSPLLSNGLGSPILSPGGTNRGTGKVIESLTNDLDAARSALDDTKIQLRTSHRTIQTLQRNLDEMKETLGRSRTENERLGQMMTRKERQVQEALERARKAETESKELGKSSREWGARVRKIEGELGDERILKQRAENQYEAISISWKQIREAWEKEMNELRENQGDAVKRNKEEAYRLLTKFKEAEEHWKGREEEGKVLQGVIEQLKEERKKATVAIEKPVQDLVDMLTRHEKHTSNQDAAVEEVSNELKRILRLMRGSQSA